MKSKLVAIVIAVVALLGITGGAFAVYAHQKPHYADDAFLKSMSKGLEDRWSVVGVLDKDDAKQTEAEYNKELRKGIEAELKQISKYKTEEFKSSKLQELAVSYINALNQQKDNINGHQNYDSSAYQKFGEAYDKRSLILVQLVKKYGLTVSDKYKETLKDLEANGKDVTNLNEQQKQVNQIGKELTFNQVSDEYGYKTYECVLTNTSDIDFEYYQVEVTMLDTDGVNIDTTYANVQNWKQGAKARFDFSTNENFDKLDYTITWSAAE